MSEKDFSAKNLLEFSNDKLGETFLLLKKELFNLRFQRALGELTNTARFRKVKKSIARVKTEVTKRTRGENK